MFPLWQIQDNATALANQRFTVAELDRVRGRAFGSLLLQELPTLVDAHHVRDRSARVPRKLGPRYESQSAGAIDCNGQRRIGRDAEVDPRILLHRNRQRWTAGDVLHRLPLGGLGRSGEKEEGGDGCCNSLRSEFHGVRILSASGWGCPRSFCLRSSLRTK